MVNFIKLKILGIIRRISECEFELKINYFILKYKIIYLIKLMETNYLTSIEELNNIFEIINIDPNLVTNCYNYGSRVHKSASNNSDYDISVVANIKLHTLRFKKNSSYFHYLNINTL